MANNNDKQRRGSKRTKTKRKPQRNDNDKGTREKERTNTIPRLDAVEKMPSNAPTMAIAPSDYEHIFHEAAPVANDQQNEAQRSPSPGPATPHQHTQPSPPSPPPSPAPPPSPVLNPQVEQRSYARRNEQDYISGYNARGQDLQVTPDGYTLLGRNQDQSVGQRRVALPPHIVRANNQFSRAALARIARYLASRAESR